MTKKNIKTEELEKRIEELENQSRSYRDQLKRALADYQNLEKRVLQERSEWIKSANKEVILRILPVLDTLMMARQHSQDENLLISIKQLKDVFKAEGVVRIETVGQDFNPQTMECVATDVGEENKVLEELQAGYMLGDKILRPAQVKVGKTLS